MQQPAGREKTTIKALGISGGYGGAPCSVDYKAGKVIRIRPLHFDEKYDPASGLRFNAWVEEDR